MTMPRSVRPGVTWFVTHRTTGRYHLFSPDDKGRIAQAYWYATAVYAERLGIRLHATELLSTHSHEILTDTRGNLSRFFELRNRALANIVKAVLGWPEEVFRKAPANWVELRTPAAVISKMAYTMANCVAAGLVRTPRRWPGVKVLAEDVGRRVVRVTRPSVYLNANNPKWPDKAEIPIVLPPVLGEAFGNDRQGARSAIRRAAKDAVRRAQQANAAAHDGYAGAKRVLRMSHLRRATTPEPVGRLNPTFSSAGNRELSKTFLAERRAFRDSYRSAWVKWQSGDHDALFPFGTWKMKRVHQARCGPPL